jgi:hypothetical protein
VGHQEHPGVSSPAGPGYGLTSSDLARAVLDVIDDLASIRDALGVGPAK